jgi:hypothetical protein
MAAPAVAQDEPPGSRPSRSADAVAVADATLQEAPAWPCRLLVRAELIPAATMAWDRSSTFREQCRTLGAAGAVVIVQPMTKHDTASAISWIGVEPNGITVARVRLFPGSRAVELLAHEVEHVLERIEESTI